MPLAWDLTAEIRAWLTPEKLRELNAGWRSQGGGHSDAAIDSLAALLLDQSIYYEQILGSLEVNFKRHGNQRQDYYGLYAWLVELVYILLYQRHILNGNIITHSLRYLEGIAGLARSMKPLWVFSLNHDLIVECLAAHYDIRLDCGFSGERALPLRDKTGTRIGDLSVAFLKGNLLATSGLDFRNLSEPGLNLIKLHGALDVFTIDEGRDLIKLTPSGKGVAGVLQSLRAANENLLYADPRMLGGKVKTTNEISYADDVGIMQFLRRTILAGAFKFDQQSTQVLPPAFLKQFKDYLLQVSHLVCLGYGFGDVHINKSLRQWLEFTGTRRIEIVAPGNKTCPTFLGHLADQVISVDAFATDYLERHALSPLSFRERAEKAILRQVRERQRKTKGFA